jgi:hypothetical protein
LASTHPPQVPDDDDDEDGDHAEADLASAPKMAWETTYAGLQQACAQGAGGSGGSGHGQLVVPTHRGLVLALSAWDENTIRADTLIGGAEVGVQVVTSLATALQVDVSEGTGVDDRHTGGTGVGVGAGAGKGVGGGASAGVGGGAVGVGGVGAGLVHTEVLTFTDVVLKGDPHNAQLPCGYLTVTLRIQVHCTGTNGTSGSSNSVDTSSNSSSGSVVPHPSDRVVIQVLKIDARDLRDVEMGFLGMKSEEDKNDVYVKLRLGNWYVVVRVLVFVVT